MTDSRQGISNEFAVAGKTFSTATDSFFNEVNKDWHSGRLAATVGLTAVTGAGIEMTLAHSPVLLKSAVGLAGLAYLGYQAYQHTGDVANYFGNAWDATTDQQRNQVATAAGLTIGREGATFAEGTLGFGIGGIAGKIAVNNVPAIEQFAFKVTNRAEFAARTAVPEQVWFKGPGSMRLSEDLVKPNGNINALRLSEVLNQPYRGVEVGRSIDVASGRASVSMPGTPTKNWLGFQDQPGRVYFHTHAPLETARPGLYDVLGTADMGIIRTDTQASVFKGMGVEFRGNLAKTGDVARAVEMTQPKLNSLILDHGSNQAYILQSTWEQAAAKPYWRDTARIPVDYQAARTALTDINPSAGMDFLKALYPASQRSTGNAVELALARAGGA